jgi:hypothetical protein
MRGGPGAAGADLRPGRHSGKSPVVSVAGALSGAVSHAEGGTTQSIRRAFTPVNYEFATHRFRVVIALTVSCTSTFLRRDRISALLGRSICTQ